MASDPAAFIHKRVGHIAVVWQDLVVAWGGLNRPYDDKDPSRVLIRADGKWISKTRLNDAVASLIIPSSAGYSWGREAEKLWAEIWNLTHESWS